jgi:L-malate glycosyltransferase
MKILILSDASSIHTIKWVNALSDQGFEIAVFSLKSIDISKYQNPNKIKFYSFLISDSVFKSEVESLNKVMYFKSLPKIKQIIKKFNPDIVHAHYASSYGLLGALTGFHPFIISLWGSDVFDFPKRNIFFKNILKYNLSKADVVLSTSEVMAKEAKMYTDKLVFITPFGVNTEVFNYMDNLKEKNFVTIGTIKTLEYKYGIDILIYAFEILVKRNAHLNLRLLIIGDGKDEDSFKSLVNKLNLGEKVFFQGQISNQQVPVFLNSFDVYVALSREESFGVAIVEAMSCQIPVVVSDVGGLPEVVDSNVNGFVVPSENIEEAAFMIEKIINDEKLAKELGLKAREKVLKYYDWRKNVELMSNIYMNIVK